MSEISEEVLCKGVKFDPVVHKYTNILGEQYISGTTFVGLFKPKFDKEFWSTYKALERLLKARGDEKVWKDLKYKWLRCEDKDWFYFQTSLVEKELLDAEIQTILKEWDTKSEKALTKGTAFHDDQERQIREEGDLPDEWDDFMDLRFGHLEAKLYPELRLYNHEYKIAGSSDKTPLLKDGTADIRDYKTNEKLTFDSWENPWTKSKSMMLGPASHLPDCSFSHYTLQLSLYAWMLEELGWKPRNLVIEHAVHHENSKGEGFWVRKMYPTKYLRGTILEMVQEYKLKQDEQGKR